MDKREFNRHFKEQNLTLVFMAPVGSKSYTTINGMLKEVNANLVYWNECTMGLCSVNRAKLMNLKVKLEEAVSKIEILDWPEILKIFKPQIDGFNSIQQNSQFNVISSRSDIAVKLKKLYMENSQSADGFIKFINGWSMNVSNKNELFGVLEAYNYFHGNVSIEKTQAYEIALSEVSSEYISEIDEIQERYRSNVEVIEDHYSNLKQKNDSWQENKTDEINELLRVKNEKLCELEELYDEKLKLQSPAKYWEELEGKFKKEGLRWLIAAVCLAIATIGLLALLLYKLPSSLDVSIYNVGLNTIRGTLILTVMISIAVYLIRLMVKMAMSAYHLSRDAKERHQLSYFYLSLIRDKAIKEEDRMIVLQALFSRSDTGLIKGDSSPAFPIDSMIAQIAKNMVK